MKISYNKLWKLLIDKGMKKSQLREAVGASKSTFAKLGKNENVTLPIRCCYPALYSYQHL